MDQLKVGGALDVDSLNATVLALPDHVLLADDVKVWLMREQRQHDQIGVRTVEAVARVRIVVGLGPSVSDEVKHLVLALSGNGRVRQNDLVTL